MCLAVPGKLVSVVDDPEPALRRGKVDFGGVKKEISLAFTPEAAVGSYVLVHVGYALSVVDEEEAQKIFEVPEGDAGAGRAGGERLMKFMDEYRDREAVRKLAGEIRRTVSRPWTLMEVCGGQTHTMLKSGLLELLPEQIEMVHGPGCPVCVTPLEQIDKAIAIALRPGVIFCSFGDMLRVPGSRMSLFDAKARGADVRIVYSPADAVKLAAENPAREVVFFAVGFETTAPANAMAAWQAARLKLPNFSLLVAHVLVPPAMEAVLASSSCRVRAFLAPGHVCTVVGFADYERVVERHRVPVVITGFEPLDLMEGMLLARDAA